MHIIKRWNRIRKVLSENWEFLDLARAYWGVVLMTIMLIRMFGSN